MNDDLIYRIFVELAVLEGKRNVDGTWTTSEPDDLAKLLTRAFGMVARAGQKASAKVR